MASDKERREVARRLRSFVTDDSVYAVVDACRVLHSIGLYYKDIDRIYFSGFDVARLADLIEPSEPQVKRELKYRSRCDELGAEMKRQRDALLKLADEMETADPEDLNVAIDYITECASRISETFGA